MDSAIVRRRIPAQMRADPSGGPTARECAPSLPATGSQRRSGSPPRDLLDRGMRPCRDSVPRSTCAGRLSLRVGPRWSGMGSLGPGEVVEARGCNRLDVARAGRIRVDQRGIAPPIFARGVGEEDFWHPTARGEAFEEAVAPTADRIGGIHLIEWERVARQRRRRLPKAHVEVAAALAAGDVNQHAVEYHPFRLVFIEAEIGELAQKTPA